MNTQRSRSLFASLLLACILIVSALGPARAAPGDLDPSFDNDGIVTARFPGGAVDQAAAVRLDVAGRIIVVGSGLPYCSRFCTWPSARAVMARFHPDGSPDLSFGNAGVVRFAERYYWYGMALDAQGRIILAGTYNTGPEDSDVAITRYNADGTLDATFGAGGVVIADFGRRLDKANAVALDRAGRIFVAIGDWSGDFVVACYRPDGRLDPNFSGDGQVVIDFGEWWGTAHAIAIDDTGRIVVAGTADSKFALARLTHDGHLSKSFAGDGMVITQISEWGDDTIRAITLSPEGRIVVAGESRGNFTVARYTRNGELDETFDDDGVVITEFPGYDGVAQSVALDSVGRVIVAGRGNSAPVMIRYTQAGMLDTTFDGDGILAAGPTADWGSWDAVTVDPADQIVVGGASRADHNLAVGRYDTDGSSNGAFGTGGIAAVQADASSAGKSVALDADGHMIVLGSGLMRFNPDGALDPTFGVGGKTLTTINMYLP